MTLNDIILRDLEICRREEEAAAAKRSLAAYERDINRRLWRRRMKKFGEIFLGALTFVLFAALMVACLACSGYHWE